MQKNIWENDRKKLVCAPKNMKKVIASIAIGVLLLITGSLKAQLKVASAGLFVQEGTVFSTDGLTLVPSEDWTVNNLTVTKDFSVVIWPKFNSIVRMYRFTRPTTFTGEVAMKYLDVELNGNEAKNLVLSYSKTTSSKYTDFTLVKESVSSATDKYVGQLFTSPITFADLTAVSMEITEAPEKLEANNMITPNGDGTNDFWIVKNIDQFPNNEVRIVDREGRLVFSMNSYDNSWDGRFNGMPLPEDTYYYILYFNSGKSQKTGFITIVKDK